MNRTFNGFIIGGSPSTGSSLLRQILNRHSSIVCAPETHLFAKPGIVSEWDQTKFKLAPLLPFKFKDLGLFPFNGLNNQEIPNYKKKKLRELISKSSNVFSFFESLMREFFDLELDQVYGEKTPGNVFNFEHILNGSEKFLCVHTVRNPYDVMASLVARGKSIPMSVAFYLMNTSHVLNVTKSDRVLTIRYENLVSNPQEELSQLLDALQLKFESQMLKPGKSNPNEITKIDSWKYDESEKIQTGSIGRFHQLDQSVKEELIAIAWHLRLKGVPAFSNLKEIGEALKYKVHQPKHDLTVKQIESLKSFQQSLKNIQPHYKSSNLPFEYS